jgi:alkanesulfonate monooxygenase SsuD/methylene tetrahydromethanopterin reductase-like flavin-dependent oxidoreductase (luciferase family)
VRLSAWPTAEHPWHTLLRLSLHAEEAGYHGLWIMDHFMPNTSSARGPMHECFAVLAALAAAVPRMRLGSLVAGNTYRHPAVLANQARTIDHVSGGRFVLGLGAGWQRNEHERYGIDLPPSRALLRRFEEACRVVRALRDQELADVDGDFYRLHAAPMEPKPVGRMPLMIGAAGERVMPGIVARQAEEWNVWGTPEHFARKNALMTEACERHGRDPGTLWRTTQARIIVGEAFDPSGEHDDRRTIGGSVERLADTMGRYAEAGVDEFIVTDGHLGGEPDRSEELFDLVMREVLPRTG